MANPASGGGPRVRTSHGVVYVPDTSYWADFKIKTSRALLKTANSIKLDTTQDQVIPFDNGLLQASAHPQLQTDGSVNLEYTQNYAAKQYFDASIRHNKGPHAGTAKDHWLDPYLAGGTKSEWVQKKFSAHLRKELGVSRGSGGGTGGSGNNNNGTP